MNNATTSMTNEVEVNIVRFAKGTSFRRFEVAKGCSVATLHSDSAPPRILDLDDARAEQLKLMRQGGWTISAV